MPEFGPGLAMCKANALSAVLCYCSGPASFLSLEPKNIVDLQHLGVSLMPPTRLGDITLFRVMFCNIQNGLQTQINIHSGCKAKS